MWKPERQRQGVALKVQYCQPSPALLSLVTKPYLNQHWAVTLLGNYSWRGKVLAAWMRPSLAVYRWKMKTCIRADTSQSLNSVPRVQGKHTKTKTIAWPSHLGVNDPGSLEGGCGNRQFTSGEAQEFSVLLAWSLVTLQLWGSLFQDTASPFAKISRLQMQLYPAGWCFSTAPCPPASCLQGSGQILWE